MWLREIIKQIWTFIRSFRCKPKNSQSSLSSGCSYNVSGDGNNNSSPTTGNQESNIPNLNEKENEQADFLLDVSVRGHKYKKLVEGQGENSNTSTTNTSDQTEERGISEIENEHSDTCPSDEKEPGQETEQNKNPKHRTWYDQKKNRWFMSLKPLEVKEIRAKHLLT